MIISRHRKNFTSLLFFLTFSIFVASLFCSVLKIYFLDVGQSDSVFIITPNGKTMLYDAGDKDEFFDYGEKICKFLWQINIRKIDIVVISHPHKDHIGGLNTVLANFTVGKFYDPGFPYPSSIYMELLQNIYNNGIKYILAREGTKIELDPRIEILILYPPKNLVFEDPNNNSVVIRIKYNKIAVMLTGDIEKDAEYEILNIYKRRKELLEANILKVAHHGSATSTTEIFLDTVMPEVAVISCGLNNRFGHPHPSVIKRLKNYGVEIYRTDRDGTIEVIIDGEDYKIRKFLPKDKDVIFSR
ncbi:MAG: MBL fold metallo-hydrolase [Endomicrobia bacterium]|nr:MBL fold metallo-hydrolase [Endomicrobiia bacterium]MDW8055645.1 ComEC/Rec2 family competence protein [Elusimicrobiota bacterium]